MRPYLLILLLLVGTGAFAQQANPLPVVQQKMQALKWLVGKWQGPVAINGEDGKKHEFKHTLEFAPKLGNTVLFLNEAASQGQDTIFQNVGFFGYNTLQSKYTLQAYAKDGSQIEAYVEVLDKKTIWRFHTPAYIVRYTAQLNDKGQWHQVGEISADEGKIWKPFFESTLTKIK